MAKKNGSRSNEATRVSMQSKRILRTFPGPEGAEAALRIAFTRRAYADVVAHAKESLEAEVCGVLVGDVCEDSRGRFVDVKASIAGSAAREARAHVTFTHETWNEIHATIDREYPELQIVGWYHTHPGFGVEFSAMDRFIHENFFSGETQVALLVDPLSGDVAVAMNSGRELEYIDRFWVDGREHAAKGSRENSSPAAAEAGAVTDVALRRSIERLESRVSQLVAALDEQRANFYRMLTTILVVACTAVVVVVGYHLWSDRFDRLKPPEVTAFAPVPVKIGDETVMLGVGVLRWDVPPRLDALMNKIAKEEVEQRLLLELQRKQAMEKTNQKGRLRFW